MTRENSIQPQWQPSTPAIDAESFNDIIEAPLALIHFWAPWNPYDKTFDANLAALRPAYKRMQFFSANTDQTSFTPIVDAHHIGALPALLCFASGRVRGRFHGIQTPEALKAFLDEMAQTRDR